MHTLPLSLILLQVGGVCVTDETGSERARQLLKATQLRHNRIKHSALLNSKLQAVPIKKWRERILRNQDATVPKAAGSLMLKDTC